MKYFTLIAAFISCMSAAQEGGESGTYAGGTVLQAPRLETSFQPVQTPIQSEHAFSAWLDDNKQLLGMSDAAQIQVLQSTYEDNGYSIYRIQQQLNNIDVFTHQSVLILSQGQPVSAHLVTTDLPAQPPPDMASLQQTVSTTLANLGIEYQHELMLKPVYFKKAKELVSAAVVRGKFQKNQLDYLYTLVISSTGTVLQTIPNHLDFSYGLIDVDEMCRAVGYQQPTTIVELLIMADSGYIQAYPPAESPAMASTTSERQLATMLNNAGAYLNDQFGHPGIDRDDKVQVLAFVGDKFYEESLSCAGNNTSNAFWTELSDSMGLMQIHAPLLQNPEVIMHELTHGIVAFGAGLVYQQQSGALNEAIGDAIGVGFVSWMNKRLDAPASTDWQLKLGNEVIRDFSYPTNIQNMPDHYSERYTGSKDYGGVHINSSIINHAFYLLSEGGAHRRLGGDSVPKIGMQKALQIWQYGATKILTQTSDFEDARYAFAKSAEIIFGKYSEERTAVHMAFDAIGVKGRWTKNVPPPPAPKVDPKPDPIPDPIPDPKPDPKADPQPDPVPDPQADSKADVSTKLSTEVMLLAAGSVFLLLVVLYVVLKRSRPSKPDNPAYAPYNINAGSASAQSHLDKGAKSDPVVSGNYGFFVIGDKAYSLSNATLSDKGITIGRAESATISLAHPSVSSFHIRLFLEDKGLYVEDLGSTYGTFINAEKINKHQKVPVEIGDKIVLADLSCELSNRQPSAPQKTANKPKVSSTLTLLTDKGRFQLHSEKVLDEGVKIGRNESCSLVIHHDSVSGTHGKFLFKEGRWYFQDLGSSYGSFLQKNNKLESLEKHSEQEIRSGSILFLADFKIAVDIDQSEGKVRL